MNTLPVGIPGLDNFTPTCTVDPDSCYHWLHTAPEPYRSCMYNVQCISKRELHVYIVYLHGFSASKNIPECKLVGI